MLHGRYTGVIQVLHTRDTGVWTLHVLKTADDI